jgi:hypothetical protein
MNISQPAVRIALVLACAGMVVPEHAFAAAPGPSEQVVRDLSLGDNGTLTGQVVNSQGLSQSGAQVQILQRDKQVASTTTDAEGNFSVAGLRGGVHQIAAGAGMQVYRFWSSNTAPPAAASRAMIVSDTNIVRGGSRGGVMGFLTNPWFLAGGVATAIAVPIALNNDDGNSGS